MKRLLQACVLLMLLSCAPPEKSFHKHGVSFHLPDGWKITEEEDLDGKGYYLSCEKVAVNASGLVTVSWVNDSMDLASIANSYGAELEKAFKKQKASIRLNPVMPLRFKDQEAAEITYTLKLMQVDHEGRIICFYGDHKTITLMVQGAVEDRAANQPGMEEILNSLVASPGGQTE